MVRFEEVSSRRLAIRLRGHARGAARELSERAEARLLAAVGGLEVFSVLSLRGSVFVHFWSGSVQSLVSGSYRWSSLAVQS